MRPDMETTQTLAKRLPPSQRTTYQFPVYEWLGWLAVAGFAIGLTVMFFISGMFGVPAPLAWAFLVIVFTFGAMLLDRPKFLLTTMLFYFLLMPGNRLLGLLGIPLPGFIDELFFLPLIAVIAMNWIQRRQLREATMFPVVFLLLAALSWYVNRPSPFRAVQVTLIMLKSYIIWYYCRLTCTFENDRQLSKWVWGYVAFVAVQFLYNVLWQRALWPRYHPDISGGVFGPDALGGAHYVGYFCVFALILLAGWWLSQSSKVSRTRRWGVALVALVITYNLVFMTDTKHALFLFPLVFAPFLFHPHFPVRLRLWLLLCAAVFLGLAVTYLQMSTDRMQTEHYFRSVKDSPKAEMLYAVTADFQYLVPYPLLGAGPGMFASNQARDDRTPLARRYIIPYYDEARRLKYFKMQGTTIISSVLGSVNTDFFVLMGEFGWLGTVVFYGFYLWVAKRLFQKSQQAAADSVESGYFLALGCCMIFLVAITVLTSASTVYSLVFPLWMIIGRIWDMRPGDAETAPVLSSRA